MKLVILGGGAGILYPITRVLTAITGPTDRMPEYPPLARDHPLARGAGQE